MKQLKGVIPAIPTPLHENDISLLNGADGVITGGGTVFLDILMSLYNGARNGDKTAAFECQQQFSAKMNDIPFGAALCLSYLCRSGVRA